MKCCYFRGYAAPYGAERENCELSDRDTRDLDVNNPSYFETTGDYDFYERFGGRSGGDCLDGMEEFSVRLVKVTFTLIIIIIKCYSESTVQ